MKKIMSVLLIVCLCVTITPFSILNLTANAATRGQFVYKLVNGEAVITDIDESAYEENNPNEFTIVPGAFRDKGIDVVAEIADNAFADSDRLQSVTLFGVKKVGKDAFANCPKLETVVVYNPNCEFVLGSGLNANQTIYGFKDSTAETLAKNIGAKFVEVKKVHSHIYDGKTCGEPTACIECGAKGPLKEHCFFECYGSCMDCGKKIREDQHWFWLTSCKKATFEKNGSIKGKCCWCPEQYKKTIKRVKSVKLSTTTYTYNGKVKKPTVTVKDTAGKKLKNGKDYKVTYAKGRKNVGTYKVTVTLKGNYAGKKVLSFKINPPKTKISKTTAGKKKLTVTVSKKKTQISGYQIERSTSKSFKNAKKITLKGYKATKYTIKGLKAKKTYYVRVRTYKTVGGKKYYSAWSSYKSKKTK